MILKPEREQSRAKELAESYLNFRLEGFDPWGPEAIISIAQIVKRADELARAVMNDE